MPKAAVLLGCTLICYATHLHRTVKIRESVNLAMRKSAGATVSDFCKMDFESLSTSLAFSVLQNERGCKFASLQEPLGPQDKGDRQVHTRLRQAVSSRWSVRCTALSVKHLASWFWSKATMHDDCIKCSVLLNLHASPADLGLGTRKTADSLHSE